MRRSMNAPRGFTLLEIVVAFAIAALSVTALMKIFGTALTVTDRAGGMTQATLIAQSKLEALGTAFPIEDSTQAGEELGGQYRWQLTIEPFEPPKIESPDAPVALTPLIFPLEMKKVVATVTYDDPPRTLTLTTYRTVAKKV